jgi:hypothetical protein
MKDKLDLLIEKLHGEALIENAKRTPKKDMVEEARKVLEEDILSTIDLDFADSFERDL